MKKYLLILTFLCGSFSLAFAQEGEDVNRQEKIQALYVAYVTQQLKLTPDEAQKFWPVHAQFNNELKGVRHELPELEKQQQYLNIKKKYQESFTRIIGVNRCERFIRIDGEFKRKLMDRVQKQRNNQQRPRPNMRRGQ